MSNRVPLNIAKQILADLSFSSIVSLKRHVQGSSNAISFPSHDLLEGAMLLIVCCLLQFIDASRIYHTIRGQSVIKLYVIFNVFEILDKLCCSIGVDVVGSFFSAEEAVGSPATATRHPTVRLDPWVHFLLIIVYVCKARLSICSLLFEAF